MLRTDVDSAYSWIVAGSSFVMYMIMYGAYRLSGILFIASMPRYGVGREAASFPYTFAGFTKNVSGPLVGLLLHKFRIRTLILSGCALAAFGIGACFLAENIFVVTVLWGVVFGFGIALACSLLPVLINQHFLRHRATAAGLAFSGMCVGTMIFPPLVEICIEHYGISGTFLILSGLVLNCFPLGIFLRARIPDKKTEQGGILERKSTICASEKTPLLAANNVTTKQNGQLYSSMSRTISSNEDVGGTLSKRKNSECREATRRTSNENGDESNLKPCGENLSAIKTKDDHTPIALQSGQMFGGQNLASYKSNETNNIPHNNNEINHNYEVTCEKNNKYVLEEETFNKIKDDNLFPNNAKVENSVSEHLQTKKTNLVKKNYYQNDILKVVEDSTIVLVPDNTYKQHKSNEKHLNTTKDSKPICSGNCSLLLNFTYLVVVFTKTLSNTIALCVNTVIFDYSRDIGVAIEYEKYVLIFSSMGELLGRLVLGRVTDVNCMSKSMFLVVCSVGQGLGALAIAWSTGFYFLSAGLFVYSFMGSVVQFMMPLVIADGVEESKQAFAITSSSFLAGPASLAISPLIGYLRDEIGTYTYLFYGIGALCGLTAVIWLIGYFLMKPKPSYAKINQTS